MGNLLVGIWGKEGAGARAVASVRTFVREHAVLLIAAAAAAVTMLVVPPDGGYLGYVDWNTLGCLFCVLAVANAFRYLGAFDRLARLAIERFSTSRSVVMALVLTTGVLSMAANLCGMVLPFGNPQNLYLYSYYALDLGDFLRTMALPFVLSAALVVSGTLALTRGADDKPASMEAVSRLPLGRRRLLAYSLLLALTALAVFRVVPVWAVALVVLAVLAYADRRALKAVDYPLLITFACFFVFAGNMARMPFLGGTLASLMAADGLLASIALSQVISNVPAAVLLSHFTGQWAPLLVGVNIGGAGTPVGSLASLIVLQHFISVPRVFSALRGTPDFAAGRFVGLFTVLNVGFLVVLFVACRACGL